MNIKNSIIALSSIIVIATSCKKETNFATITGKITNKNSNSVFIMSQAGYKKEISVDEQGNFKDTLHIKDDFYNLYDGVEFAKLYLQKGDDITLTIDAKQFDETINFTGNGASESAFLAKATIKEEQFLADQTLFDLPKEAFSKKVDSFTAEFNSLLNDKSLDPNFVSIQKKEVENLKDYLLKSFDNKNYVKNVLSKGKPAPKFTDYENIKGGKTSLDDFKGKYVYIDVWATWCNPCKQEIPYLQKLEEQFKGKNIAFVSISADAVADKETWKKMIADKNMVGVQLFSNKDLVFMDKYKVSSIPRFILIDPKGNIVDANAPRPSQPKTAELLKSLL